MPNNLQIDQPLYPNKISTCPKKKQRKFKNSKAYQIDPSQIFKFPETNQNDVRREGESRPETLVEKP